eukprot:jgi/Mesen1/10644/ME000896S10102
MGDGSGNRAGSAVARSPTPHEGPTSGSLGEAVAEAEAESEAEGEAECEDGSALVNMDLPLFLRCIGCCRPPPLPPPPPPPSHPSPPASPSHATAPTPAVSAPAPASASLPRAGGRAGERKQGARAESGTETEAGAGAELEGGLEGGVGEGEGEREAGVSELWGRYKYAGTVSQLQRIFVVTAEAEQLTLGSWPSVEFQAQQPSPAAPQAFPSAKPPSTSQGGPQFRPAAQLQLPANSFLCVRLPLLYYTGDPADVAGVHPLVCGDEKKEPHRVASLGRGSGLYVMSSPGP